MKYALYLLLAFHSLSVTGQVAIQNDKENGYYLGIPTHVTIAAKNYSCEDLIILIDSGIITKDVNTCEYYITAYKPGELRIKIEERKTHKVLCEKRFRAKYMPLPTPMVGGRNRGKISKKYLENLPGLFAVYPNIEIDSRFIITAFTVIILRDNRVLFIKDYSGAKFEESVFSAFRTMKKDDKLFFVSIQCKGPASELSDMPSMEFIITD
ncbi:MAG: hypothetical protein H0X33_07005 [Taibaiella sp.]|nr:hypothetical protein [Taibaiella sp.]